MPIHINLVDPNSSSSINARHKSKSSFENRNGISSHGNVNTNYFFSRGLFEKIKERINWANSSSNQRSDSIQQAIAPIIQEMVLDANSARQQVYKLSNFLYEVLDNDCYSNLVGLSAHTQKNVFKRLFSGKCNTELYNISDEVVRLNMPSVLISLYDPTILPPASEPTRKATPAQRAELAKYFSVSMNTHMVNTSGVESSINGAAYGLIATERGNKASEVLEFTSLISTWQSQQNLDLDFFDRSNMIKERN
jgi:hypothetical protein